MIYWSCTFEKFRKLWLEYEILEPQFSCIQKSAAQIWDIHTAVFMHSQKCGSNIPWKLRGEYPIFALHFCECMKTAGWISHIWAALLRMCENCGANMRYNSQKCGPNTSYSHCSFHAFTKVRREYGIFIPQFSCILKSAARIWDIHPAVLMHSQKCGTNMGYSPRSFHSFTKVQHEYGIFMPQFSCILKSAVRIWNIRAALLRMHENCGVNIPYSRRTFVSAWKLQL